MPAGLQVWDAAGNLILDTSYRTGFVLGKVDIANATNASGNVTDANFANGTPFYFYVADNTQALNEPTVAFAGNTMTWTATTSSWTGSIYYGIY